MDDSSTAPVWACLAMSAMASAVQVDEPVPIWGHGRIVRASSGQNTTQRWQFTQARELMTMQSGSFRRRCTPLAQERTHWAQSVQAASSRTTR